ncbi:MAG: DUF3078 domain-containing protein [Rhodothermia bacterium]|nr:DUF3078 domain-containing protein [Rhodothermia bacterium]
MKRYGLKILAAVTVVLAMAFPARAQEAEDAPPPPPPEGWQPSAALKVAGSQVGFSNWQGGGINSLAVTGGIEALATKETVRTKQKLSGRFGLGGIKQDTLDLRKSEDILQGRYSVRYKGDGFLAKWNPTFAAELRTQFLEGFDYGVQPEAKVSDFFAPAYVTQALGLTYAVNGWFTQRFGLGAKETIVRIEELRGLYGLDMDESMRFEAGLESHTEVDRNLAENINYKSVLSLFAAFGNPDKPDAIWENLITMKVNDWLQTNFELVLLYDDDVSSKVQLKEVFSVGVTFLLL